MSDTRLIIIVLAGVIWGGMIAIGFNSQQTIITNIVLFSLGVLCPSPLYRAPRPEDSGGVSLPSGATTRTETQTALTTVQKTIQDVPQEALQENKP